MSIKQINHYNIPNGDFVKFINSNNNITFTLTDLNVLAIYRIQQNHNISNIHIAKVETVPYQIQFYKDAYILSSKDMPTRIYSLIDHTCIGSVSDHKQNSQKFLSPISMKIDEQNDFLIGGGKKFLMEYDLIKNTRKYEYKEMNKKYISTVTIASQERQYFKPNNLVIAGQFDGTINIISNVEKKIISKFKCHFDAINDIKYHPFDSNFFISTARKDNFKYMWDLRNLSTFVMSYQLKTYTNQRINFQFNKNGSKLLCGSETGQLIIFDILTGNITNRHKIYKSSLNYLHKYNEQHILVSCGERVFELQQKQLNHQLKLLNFVD